MAIFSNKVRFSAAATEKFCIFFGQILFFPYRAPKFFKELASNCCYDFYFFFDKIPKIALKIGKKSNFKAPPPQQGPLQKNFFFSVLVFLDTKAPFLWVADFEF